jgi:hypothetical protein
MGKCSARTSSSSEGYFQTCPIGAANQSSRLFSSRFLPPSAKNQRMKWLERRPHTSLISRLICILSMLLMRSSISFMTSSRVSASTRAHLISHSNNCAQQFSKNQHSLSTCWDPLYVSVPRSRRTMHQLVDLWTRHHYLHRLDRLAHPLINRHNV